MGDKNLIPREKACFYWNDVPSSLPENDVLVLSVDDPDRDAKSARFDNSTGAPLVEGFLKNESAESIFIDYLGGDAVMALTPEQYAAVNLAWTREFYKIEGFKDPDCDPEIDWVRFTGTLAEIKEMEGILVAIGMVAFSVGAMRKTRGVERGYEIWLSNTRHADELRVGQDIGRFLLVAYGSHDGIKVHGASTFFPARQSDYTEEMRDKASSFNLSRKGRGHDLPF